MSPNMILFVARFTELRLVETTRLMPLSPRRSLVRGLKGISGNLRLRLRRLIATAPATPVVKLDRLSCLGALPELYVLDT